MKNLFIISSIFLLSFNLGYAQGGKTEKAINLWDELLGTYVTPGGHVNYEGFKQDKNFQKCLDLFTSQGPQDSWTRDQKMAYWINVYNAFTVKLIVDHYPLESIKDIEEPWDIALINIDGKSYTLNNVEHDILRPDFKDPRVHFAVNCASFSCPVLHNEAIRAESLNSTLDTLTKNFLNDIHRNRISSRKAEISKIFEWFKDDFATVGGVRKFIEEYRGSKINPDLELTYIPYDWKLNSLK